MHVTAELKVLWAFAAVVGLTGSVDGLSPRQHCLLGQKPENIWWLSWTQQFLCFGRRVSQRNEASACTWEEEETERKRNGKGGGLSFCGCVDVLRSVKRWKEEQTCEYCFSFHGYLLLCRNVKFNLFLCVCVRFNQAFLWTPHCVLSFQQLHSYYLCYECFLKGRNDEVQKKRLNYLHSCWEYRFVMFFSCFHVIESFGRLWTKKTTHFCQMMTD